MKRPLIIAGAYLLFGILWIYFSDLLVFQFTDDEETIHRLQNYKGFAFVFLSTLLIFSLTYILYRQVFIHQRMLQQKVDNIQEQNLRILDNEERLLQAERVGKLGSWEYDPKEKKLMWSIITAEILEFTLEDAPTTIEEFIELVSEDDRDYFSKYIYRMINEQIGFDIDISFDTPKNKVKYVRIICRAVKYDKGMVKIIGTLQDVTEKVKVLEKIAITILETLDRERAHISSEIHDSLTQKLSIVSLHLKNISKKNEVIMHNEQYQQTLTYLDEAIDESRSIAQNLMPQSIKKFGLVASIEELIESVESDESPNIQFTYNEERRLDSYTELQLFRIVQEALQNILKHARATSVDISLEFNESLHLIIKDNGVGFVPNEELDTTEHLGLSTMHYRAQQMHADLVIESEKNQGTTIKVTLKNAR